MIKVIFFASLKEALECSEETLTWHSDFKSVSDILDFLKNRGPKWRESLNRHSLLIAVNHTMAQENSPINDGDEIAFFPPVTGG